MMKMAAIVETVPRWANDTTVGGDIAQVIFDKTSNGWRWFGHPFVQKVKTRFVRIDRLLRHSIFGAKD
jgi:hypothetical protein